MLAFVLPSFARLCIAMKFGIAIAARIPMITTTIISSIRVKPFWDLCMTFDPPPTRSGPLVCADPHRGDLSNPHATGGSSRTPVPIRYGSWTYSFPIGPLRSDDTAGDPGISGRAGPRGGG